MRNPLKFTLYVMYSYYYRDGRRSQWYAYISAVTTFLLLIWANTLAIMGVFGVGARYLVPFSSTDQTSLQYMKTLAMFAIPGSLVITLLKKETIVGQRYDDQLVAKGKILVAFYFVVSFIAIMTFVKW